ncbi:hypothetical protein F4802DRAFT_610252 [Xylaria palmicola]|nr:hypothetical protein F4802DRAFT_610252 [Xylaria palmicola]
MTPGFDDKTPNQVREIARNELLATGLVDIVPRRVVSAAKGSDGLFEVVDAEGERWKGRKILLATGVKEKYPDIEGFAENYGKSIYHCLFCFGYEKRGSVAAAVLAEGPLGDIMFATVYASDTKKFADRVKIYTNGNATLAADLSTKISEGMEVDNRKLKRIIQTHNKNQDLEVEFEDGPSDTIAFMAHSPDMPVDTTLPDQLGCECVPKSGIKVNPPFNSTTVPGVYAAGDCCSSLKSVLMGMAVGSCAGVGIAREIPIPDGLA